MHRRTLRTLALPIAVTAAVAAATPAAAAPVTLDTSFGEQGFAFTTFNKDYGLGAPFTIAGPDGTIVTAAVTDRDDQQEARGGVMIEPPGLVVTRRASDGALLDRQVFPGLGGTGGGQVYDMRYFDGDLVIVGGYLAFSGRGGSFYTAWVVRVPANGDAASTSTYTAPDNEDCYALKDGAILGADRMVFAWDCDSTNELRIVNPGADQRLLIEIPQDEEQPEAVFFADQIARDSQDRLVYYVNRGKGGPAVGRLLLAEDGDHFVPDDSFDEDGEAAAPAIAEYLEVDAKNRPVLGYGSDGFFLSRLTAAGAPDESFGAEGVVRYDDERPDFMDSLGTDDQNRVLFSAGLRDNGNGRGTVRLLENGTPDETFGTNGMLVADQEDRRIRMSAPPLGIAGSTYLTFTFWANDDDTALRSTAVPAPAGVPVVALLRFADPKAPAAQQPATANAQAAPAPAPAPVAAGAPSRTPKVARTCLSRRSFSIRVRPKNRKIVSAKVKVAGKPVKVTRRNGRLTASVNLKKLKQATFTVSVVAKDGKGRTYRDLRTYRTCRVGEDGPKVKGGSTLITVGA